MENQHENENEHDVYVNMNNQIGESSVDDNTEHTIRIIRDSTTTSGQYTTRERNGEIEVTPISELINLNNRGSNGNLRTKSQKNSAFKSSNFASDDQKMGTITHIDYQGFQEDEQFGEDFEINRFNVEIEDADIEEFSDFGDEEYELNHSSRDRVKERSKDEHEDKEIMDRLESKEMREYIEVLKESIGEIYQEKIGHLEDEFHRREEKNLKRIKELEKQLREEDGEMGSMNSLEFENLGKDSQKMESLMKRIEDLEEENGLLMFRIQEQRSGMKNIGFESTVKEKSRLSQTRESSHVSRLKLELEEVREKLRAKEGEAGSLEISLNEKYKILESDLTEKFKKETGMFFQNIQKEMEDILESKGLPKKKLEELERKAKQEIKKELRSLKNISTEDKETQTNFASDDSKTYLLDTGGSVSAKKSKGRFEEREKKLEKLQNDLIGQRNLISRQRSILNIKIKKLKDDRHELEKLKFDYEEKLKRINSKLSKSKSKQLRDMELEFRREVNELSDEVDRLREELDSCYLELRFYKMKQRGESSSKKSVFSTVGRMSSSNKGRKIESFIDLEENRSYGTNNATKETSSRRDKELRVTKEIPETVRTELVMLPNTDEPTFGSRISSNNFNSRVNPDFNSNIQSKDPNNDTSNFGYLSVKNSKSYGSKILNSKEGRKTQKPVRVEGLKKKSREEQIKEYLNNCDPQEEFLYKSQDNSTLELIDNHHGIRSRFSSPEYQRNLDFSENKKSSYTERIKILGGESVPPTEGKSSDLSDEEEIRDNSTQHGLEKMMRISNSYAQDSGERLGVRAEEDAYDDYCDSESSERKSSCSTNEQIHKKRIPFLPVDESYQPKSNPESQNVFYNNGRLSYSQRQNNQNYANGFQSPYQKANNLVKSNPELANYGNGHLPNTFSMPNRFQINPGLLMAMNTGQNLSPNRRIPENCLAGLSPDQVQKIIANEYVASMIKWGHPGYPQYPQNMQYGNLQQAPTRFDHPQNHLGYTEEEVYHQLGSLGSSNLFKTEESYRKSVRSYVQKILKSGVPERQEIKSPMRRLRSFETQQNSRKNKRESDISLPSYSDYFDINLIDMIFSTENQILEDNSKTKKLKIFRNDINNIWVRDNKLLPKIISKLSHLSSTEFISSLKGSKNKFFLKKFKNGINHFIKKKLSQIENLWKDNFISYQRKLKFLKNLKQVKSTKQLVEAITKEMQSLSESRKKNDEILQLLGVRETLKNKHLSLCSKYKSEEELLDMLGNIEGKSYLDQLKFISGSILKLIRQGSDGIKYRGVGVEALVKLDLWEIDYLKKVEEVAQLGC